MAISPEQRKHAIILAGALAVVLALCWLMRVWFEQPTTVLTESHRGIVTNLPAEQSDPATPQTFTLEDGSGFNGQGKVQIGNEQISFTRITGDQQEASDAPKGSPITKGSVVARNPNTFKVIERGANGTEIVAHAVGETVDPVASIFFPENNATFGDPVDELFYIILWITGIAFVLTEAFLLFCMVCFWDKPGRRASYIHGHHKFEVGATLSVVTVLVMLALWQNEMWTSMKQVMPVSYAGKETFKEQEKNERAVHYQIIARRFQWYFRHPGLDGRFATGDDITTGTMFVPKGRDVLFHIRAQDVLHSFFLPNFRVKQDSVPGMAIPGWFQAKNSGTFQIMCAELCGEGHTTMGAMLKVQELDEYRAWVQKASEASRDENLGGDPRDPEYDPDDQADRKDWYGANAPFWWWWDANPVRVGYAEDYLR